MFQVEGGTRPILEPSAPGSYQPTQIPKEKYKRIVEGRNRFFFTTVGCVALFIGLSAIPQFLMYRCVRRVYQRHCRGKALDLSPKLYDSKDVALYEMSKVVQVDFLVEDRVVDEGHYRTDPLLSEAEQEARRRSMTLDFMIRHDHNWVGSTVNFTTVLKADTRLLGFEKYDCVVIRDELLTLREPEARNVFDSAAQYLKEDGSLLVMDVGTPSYPTLTRWVRWFNRATNSSMSFTHDYHGWIREGMQYEVREEQRCLFGFYYALVLQLRKRDPSAPAGSGDDGRYAASDTPAK